MLEFHLGLGRVDVDVDHPVRAEACEAERPPTCLHGTERFGVQEVVAGTARAAPLEDPGDLADRDQLVASALKRRCSLMTRPT